MNKTVTCNESYQKTKMQKEIIIQKLKEEGCRITKQRLRLLDIIMEEECSCCKEIYYKAIKYNEKIGTATIYRMINILEEIGAINRKNMYKISCDGNEEDCQDMCSIVFEDGTQIELSTKKWNQVIQAGLDSCGYTYGKNVRKAVMGQRCGGK